MGERFLCGFKCNIVGVKLRETHYNESVHHVLTGLQAGGAGHLQEQLPRALLYLTGRQQQQQPPSNVRDSQQQQQQPANVRQSTCLEISTAHASVSNQAYQNLPLKSVRLLHPVNAFI